MLWKHHATSYYLAASKLLELSIQNISQCLPDVSQTLGLEGCTRTWAMVLILRNAHPSGKDRKLAIKKRRFQSEMGEG